MLAAINKKVSALRYKLEIITLEQLTPDIGQVIVLGISPSWVSNVISTATAIGVKAIAVSCYPEEYYLNTSYILINHEHAMQKCLDYLSLDCGKKKTALYAINSNSYADSVKARYFNTEDIYYSAGLEKCYDTFLPNIRKYDSVICSNYISAVSLSTRLKHDGISVPDDLFIISFGDSLLGCSISPDITEITLNYEQLGVQAVMLYTYLKKQKLDLNMTVYVPCELIPRKSTNYIECSQEGTNYNPISSIGTYFLDDSEAVKIQSLEKMLRYCEDIDIKLINALLQGRSYAQLADESFLSEGALKYRMKRLLKSSGISSVNELLSLYKQYI